MNKQELVSAIAEKASITKVDAEKAINAFVETTKETLAKKGKHPINWIWYVLCF